MVEFLMAPTYNIVRTDIIIKCKMYYDKIERDIEGFYPDLKSKNGKEIIYIKFQLCYYNGVDNYWWSQISESVIYGFTINNGKQLLSLLNLNVKGGVDAKKIYNSGGRCIYPSSLLESTYHIIDQEMQNK